MVLQVEPLGLEKWPVAKRNPQKCKSFGVQPAGVTVAAGQDDRMGSADGVEHGSGWLFGPGGRSESVADDRAGPPGVGQ